MTEWRPMADAPHNGEHVLVAYRHGKENVCMDVCWFNNSDGYWRVCDLDRRRADCMDAAAGAAIVSLYTDAKRDLDRLNGAASTATKRQLRRTWTPANPPQPQRQNSPHEAPRIDSPADRRCSGDYQAGG